MNLEGWNVSLATGILFFATLINYIFNGKWLTDTLYKYVGPNLKKFDISMLQSKFSSIDFNFVTYDEMKQMSDDDYDLANPANARLSRSKELEELKERREQLQDDLSGKSNPDTETNFTVSKLVKL